jgi:ADP-ribosylglycohydrolase
MCVCDSILTAKKVDELAFAEKLFDWFEDSPMGIGHTIYKVLTMPQFRQFPHKAAEVVWKMSGRKSAANGAIMRSSILGVFEFWDTAKVIDNTERIARVTHWDPRCVGSSVILTKLISSLIHRTCIPERDAIIELGERYDSRIKPFVELAMGKNIEALQLDDPKTMGYTLKTMAAGLWAFYHAEDFEHGIFQVIQQGGDADTNACVAGSLLGAKFGFQGIPERLVRGLLRRNELEDRIEGLMS